MKGSELSIDDRDKELLERAERDRQARIEELRQRYEQGELEPTAEEVARRIISQQEQSPTGDRD